MSELVAKLHVGADIEGRFHFAGESKDELPFSRMEKLTVVSHTDDPNWIKASNSHGQEGLVPISYIAECRREPKQNVNEWFRGKITREEAEMLLTPQDDGNFLVRESTNFPGDYTLCVCFQDKVEHYRIISTNKKLTIDEEVYFDNLAQLVEHYEKDADGLCTQLRRAEPDIEVKRWYIDKRQLKLTDCIGKGEFGDVHLGDWLGRKVAVKGLKDNSLAAKSLLKEATVMSKLVHSNLVALLGIVWEESGILLVTEYMARGSLIDYLRTRGRLLITKQDQIHFACDAAAGMAYLESMKVVHRDLAARNVLINEEGTAKVCDFGLAHFTNYKLEGGKFPIKWTAPEALRQNKFSNKSDMWSFGILLWEIYSFGRVPYPRIPLADVIKYVEKGNRMEPPDDCPTPIYKIMEEAWHSEPDCRPTFKDVHSRLEHIKQKL